MCGERFLSRCGLDTRACRRYYKECRVAELIRNTSITTPSDAIKQLAENRGEPIFAAVVGEVACKDPIKVSTKEGGMLDAAICEQERKEVQK